MLKAFLSLVVALTAFNAIADEPERPDPRPVSMEHPVDPIPEPEPEL